MKSVNHFAPPPTTIRRARLDNVALVPGSALPFLDRCREVANQLPKNGILIVLSKDRPLQTKALLAVAKLLSTEGHQVRVVPGADVSQSYSDDQSEHT